MAAAYGRLAAAEMRVGAARERVIECLAREAHCLIGVNDLMERMRAHGGRGSQASLYRVLDELHGLGLLHRHVAGDGTAMYEIALPGSRHHHIVDEVSGEIVPFEDHVLEDAIVAAARRQGLRLTGHHVVLRGHRSEARG